MPEPRDDNTLVRPGFWTLLGVLGLYVALALLPVTCHLQRGTGSVRVSQASESTSPAPLATHSARKPPSGTAARSVLMAMFTDPS